MPLLHPKLTAPPQGWCEQLNSRSRDCRLAILMNLVASCAIVQCVPAVIAHLPRPSLQAFVLAVGLKFQSVEDRVEFEKIWRPLAEYVARDEPTTLAFEFLVADNDPTKVLVYERRVRWQMLRSGW